MASWTDIFPGPKANVACTPSTPAPARKRRRPNQDLQQRLAKCEELLQEYATAKPASDSAVETPDPDDSWKSLGKLIIEDDGVRFMDSYLWANIHDEVSSRHLDLVDNISSDNHEIPHPHPTAPKESASLAK